jgi:hypothetical protein
MATVEDVRRCAAMALRQRRSLPIEHYAEQIAIEDATLTEILARANDLES